MGHGGVGQVHSQLLVPSHPTVDGETPQSQRPALDHTGVEEYPIQMRLGGRSMHLIRHGGSMALWVPSSPA